jgi:TPR repeat protein
MKALAKMLREGRGVTKNTKEAKKWEAKAKE